MNNMQRAFCAIVTVWAGFLTYKVVELEKKINTYESLYVDTYRQINQNSLSSLGKISENYQKKEKNNGTNIRF